MSDEHQDRGKKTYEPPRLSIISLRPEEAVLGHCKSTVVSGPGGLGTCSPVGPCSSIGS
jgi:hypothetical protein